MKENAKVILTSGKEDEYFRVHIYIVEEENDNDK